MKQKKCCFVAWFMKRCTMPNRICWGTSWGMLEYKRWCWLTEKGQTDIVTHTTNIWIKYLKYRLRQKDFFPQCNKIHKVLHVKPFQTCRVRVGLHSSVFTKRFLVPEILNNSIGGTTSRPTSAQVFGNFVKNPNCLTSHCAVITEKMWCVLFRNAFYFPDTKRGILVLDFLLGN
jgi:hypothetical protein